MPALEAALESADEDAPLVSAGSIRSQLRLGLVGVGSLALLLLIAVWASWRGTPAQAGLKDAQTVEDSQEKSQLDDRMAELVRDVQKLIKNESKHVVAKEKEAILHLRAGAASTTSTTTTTAPEDDENRKVAKTQKDVADNATTPAPQEKQKGKAEAHTEPEKKEAHPCVVGSKKDNGTIWADPLSLFCFAVVVEDEMPLIRWQYQQQAGIFACTSWAVFSIEPMLIAKDSGTSVMTSPLPGPPAIFGHAYFFGCQKSQKYLQNANVFVRAWEKIVAEGFAGLHSWIIKVDPDTAFCPRRLQKRFSQKGLEHPDKMPGRYFFNCATFKSMQGAMEVLSRNAFYIFGGKKQECQKKMDWWHMGEDIFTSNCLKQLGVPADNLYEGVEDCYCVDRAGCVARGSVPSCSSRDVAAFHPLKHVDQFQECWQKLQHVEASLTV